MSRTVTSFVRESAGRPCAGLDRRAARGQDFARTGALVVAIDAPWSRRKELPDFTRSTTRLPTSRRTCGGTTRRILLPRKAAWDAAHWLEEKVGIKTDEHSACA